MSSFILSPEHEELRKALRRFADEEIAPHAAEADAAGEYPWASFEAYRDSGFIRLPYPEEYGGDGGDLVAYAMLVEEVARACGSSSLFVLISRLACEPILLFGSEELKQRVVPKVASGEWQGSYCLSESHAGSDVASMKTRAVRDGDHYVLTGSKSWITNAGVSSFYTVFAKTDPDAGHRGISAFVVEADAPGFSVAKLESKMGMRGSPTGEIVFDEVRVPAANLIGGEHRAFGYAMGALDGSRPTVGAQAVGIAQGALDAAARYVTEREQFGHPVAEFQGLQFMLADMATRVEAARLLVYSACARLDAGAPGTSRASAMAKLFATETAQWVVDQAVQIHGARALERGHLLEHLYREVRAPRIYEGTSEIQREVVARELFRGRQRG